MSLRQRLTRTYFNAVYNRLYDFTTGRLTKYVAALGRLTESLCAQERHKVLCVGLGTGNELVHLRMRTPCVEAVGIDISSAALARAGRKAATHEGQTSLAFMDAGRLGFASASFDRVLCYHVTDFMDNAEPSVKEMLRVLKPGGRFVISFPADGEGIGLGMGLLSHALRPGPQGRSLTTKLHATVVALLTGLVYFPLLLRERPKTYCTEGLMSLMRSHGADSCAIETDALYRDHLVIGEKREDKSIAV